MDHVFTRIEGHAGRITLNRPDVLNALTWKMVLAIETALNTWRDDPRVRLVIIDANGDRAFCAGGDITTLYEQGSQGDFASARLFWADEYRINALIREYPKPFISLTQGYTMGGGVGISLHGSHRVVCESSRISMPECSIGLVPDVGGTHLLAQAPGALGEYLALTGHRMSAAEAIHAGFADSYVRTCDWPLLVEELCRTGETSAISRFAALPPPDTTIPERFWLDETFSAPDIATLVARLEMRDEGHNLVKILRRQSPLALACTLTLIRAARRKPGLREALTREYRFSWRCMSDGDLLEGIRAAVITRDHPAAWRDSLTGVTPEKVDAMLAPLGKDELKFISPLRV